MPAKFQLNTALTRSQRDMLDAIHAKGRGPSDMVVVKMLLAALEEYWERNHVLPSPMKLVPDVSAELLLKVAEHAGEYEQREGEPGMGLLHEPGGAPPKIPPSKKKPA